MIDKSLFTNQCSVVTVMVNVVKETNKYFSLSVHRLLYYFMTDHIVLRFFYIKKKKVIKIVFGLF